MELVLYLARKSTRMATYDELVEYFVNQRDWSRSLLNAYLSELARKRVIRRAWIKAGGKRHRVYRLNESA
jgi:predicted transcriptional regulator